MDKTTAINCFVQAVVLSIFFSHYGIKKRAVFISCFGIDLFLNFFFYHYAFLSLYCMIPIMVLLMYQKRKELQKSILSVLFIFNLFVIDILFFGSILFLCFHKVTEYYHSIAYNTYYICVLLLSSVFLIKYQNGRVLQIEFKSRKGITIINIFLMCFFIFTTLLLPILLYDIKQENYAVICIFFVICIVGLYIAVCYIKKLETICYDYELKNQFYKIEKNRFDEIIRLKHYFVRLLKYCNKYLETNDIESFKSALEKNILPVQKSLSEQKTKEMIRFVSNPLLKDLLLQCASDAEQYHIDFKLELDQPILNIGMNELDLFKILNIYIENALEETANQKNGLIHILITKMQDKLIFKISNSLHSNHVKIQKQSFGKGLHIAKEIVGKYPNVNITTNIIDEVYIQMVEIGGVYDKNNH